MNSIDLFIILGAIAGFILGFKDGFVRKLIGIIGFALAIICAALFAGQLGFAIESTFGIEFYLAEIIGALLIFFGVIVLFTLIKRVVHPFDKVNNLINQLVGGAIGVIQILYFISAVLLIMSIFNYPDKTIRDKSAFYDSTHQIIPVTIEYLSDYNPGAKQIIRDYINKKDTLK
jgi:membrane protein required for colicin V production